MSDAGVPGSLATDPGAEMYRLVKRLFPICRSITGDGVRETLRILSEHIPLETHEVPTGTPVFDWEIPKEWNIREAYIALESGERLIDFANSNLHVVNYSTPIREEMSFEEVRPHLHTLPDHPDWIPYRTSYYTPSWGFCLSENQMRGLEKASGGGIPLTVVIDSTLKPGSLTYGELLIPGSTEEEVLISSHVCHPSLCNDNLSSIAVAVYLAAWVGREQRRYSYRFLFAPGTIGAIAWLARNEAVLGRVKHGLVLACLGDDGILHYKQSRFGDAEIDQVVEYSLQSSGRPHAILPFEPLGYDERQFGSPGINLPFGRLTRTPNGCYPEYHSSADDLELVSPAALEDSLGTCIELVSLLELNTYYTGTVGKCEPQLGRRGFYEAIGTADNSVRVRDAVLWVLNLADGKNSLLDIAKRSKLPVHILREAVRFLLQERLLVKIDDGLDSCTQA